MGLIPSKFPSSLKTNYFKDRYFSWFYEVLTKGASMKYKAKIILWDNDGTITASKNPNDRTSRAKIILPGIQRGNE